MTNGAENAKKLRIRLRIYNEKLLKVLKDFIRSLN